MVLEAAVLLAAPLLTERGRGGTTSKHAATRWSMPLGAASKAAAMRRWASKAALAGAPPCCGGRR